MVELVTPSFREAMRTSSQVTPLPERPTIIQDVHGRIRKWYGSVEDPTPSGYLVAMPNNGHIIGVFGPRPEADQPILPGPEDPNRRIVYDNEGRSKSERRSRRQAHRAVVGEDNRELRGQRLQELRRIFSGKI